MAPPHMAIDVAVWFGETLLEVRRLASASGCDLEAIAGCELPRDVVIEPQRLREVGDSCRFVVGDLEIIATVVEARPASLARAPIERRPYLFGACSLAAHLALAIGALVAIPAPEPAPGVTEHHGRPTRIGRFAVAEQTTRPAPIEPVPEEPPITTDDTPTEAPSLDPETDPGEATSDDATPHPLPGEAALPDVGLEPSSGDDETPDDGEHRRFDPTTSSAFDSVKSTFATSSTGRDTGDHYQLPGADGSRRRLVVVSCDERACLVLGGEQATELRSELQKRLPEIAGCFAKAEPGARKIEIDFGIDDAGKIDGVKVGGDAGSCIADIVASLDLGAKS